MNEEIQLTEKDQWIADCIELQSLLRLSHKNAAMENINNISTNTLLNAYKGSGNTVQAMAAAFLTIGHVHAPIQMTYSLISKTPIELEREFEILRKIDLKIPGVGNSFYKDQIDPCFQQAYDFYVRMCDAWHKDNLLDKYASEINNRLGKNLFPNAAGITAAIAILTECSVHDAITLFLSGRAEGWAELLTAVDDGRITL